MQVTFLNPSAMIPSNNYGAPAANPFGMPSNQPSNNFGAPAANPFGYNPNPASNPNPFGGGVSGPAGNPFGAPSYGIISSNPGINHHTSSNSGYQMNKNLHPGISPNITGSNPGLNVTGSNPFAHNNPVTYGTSPYSSSSGVPQHNQNYGMASAPAGGNPFGGSSYSTPTPTGFSNPNPQHNPNYGMASTPAGGNPFGVSINVTGPSGYNNNNPTAGNPFGGGVARNPTTNPFL